MASDGALDLLVGWLPFDQVLKPPLENVTHRAIPIIYRGRVDPKANALRGALEILREPLRLGLCPGLTGSASPATRLVLVAEIPSVVLEVHGCHRRSPLSVIARRADHSVESETFMDLSAGGRSLGPASTPRV